MPGCKLKATHTFAKAPVCECHRYYLQQEAEEAYEDRVLFESIRKHTIWKKVEPGDEKKVIVAEVKNGEITALRLKNDKFTINRRNAYKGVKVLWTV
ncbi:hypothetical protein [Paenibacillus puldeungensis]|uniref:hypothetical protein n=1 Tax=Paenibacillus puldeungensis TaxID=696536 RepID=UPI0036D2CBD2